MKSRQNSNSFSLLELLIVIALISILQNYIPIPSYNTDHALLMHELQKIVSTLHMMRQRAMLYSQEGRLICDLTQNCYQQIWPGMKPQIYHFKQAITFTYPQDSYGPPAQPNRPITTACSFAKNCIVISAEGAISSGTLYLGTKQKNHFGAISCSINPIAYPRIYRYENQTWQHIKS